MQDEHITWTMDDYQKIRRLIDLQEELKEIQDSLSEKFDYTKAFLARNRAKRFDVAGIRFVCENAYSFKKFNLNCDTGNPSIAQLKDEFPVLQEHPEYFEETFRIKASVFARQHPEILEKYPDLIKEIHVATKLRYDLLNNERDDNN